MPLYVYRGERSQLLDNAHRKGSEGMGQYKAKKNTASIDGIAGLRSEGIEGR